MSNHTTITCIVLALAWSAVVPTEAQQTRPAPRLRATATAPARPRPTATPATSQRAATQPATTQPAATQPAATQPATTQPSAASTATQPAAALPAAASPTMQPSTASDTVGDPLCPVTGKPIDRQVWVEFRSKKVYFATAAAREQFQQDPTEYRDAIKQQWDALRPLRVQVLCPVTNKPINLDISTDLHGEPIYFATAEAKAAWEADATAAREADAKAATGKAPTRYAAALEKCYTYQTLCPCGTGDIRPDVSEEYQGRTIYFCCPHCRAAFDRNRDEYLPKLDEQAKANREAWAKRHPQEPSAHP